MKFKVIYLIPVTLFALSIKLLFNLPLWIMAVPSLMLALPIIYKLLQKTMSQQRIPKIKIFSRNFATNIFFIALFLAALLILLGVIIVVGTTIIGEPQKATFSTKLKDVDGGCWGEMCEFRSSEGGSVEIKAIDDLGGKGGILTFSATGKSFSSQIAIGETVLEGPSSENGETDFSQSTSCKRGEDCKITIKVNIGKEGDVEISNLKLLYK